MDKLAQELIKSFQKDFPDTPLVTLSDDEYGQIKGWIDTSNYALNWIISKNLKNGWPIGRVSLLVGDPSTGKTAIVLSSMRDSTIDLIVYLDSEGGSADASFAEFLGADPTKILYSPVETVEELKAKMGKVIDIIEKNKSTKKVLLVVDSISMLSTEKEMDPNKGSDFGAKAKLTREYFRTYIRKIQKLNIAAVFTAHYTVNVGQMYGPPKVIAGGTILKFAPSLIVELSHNTKENEVEKSAIGASVVGLRAKILKSRLGTFGKQMDFELDLNKGLEPFSGLFNVLKDYKIIIPASSDLDAQIKEKKIPARSTGWYVFTPWEHMELFEAFKKHIRSSGKFRESEFNDFSLQHKEILLELYQKALDKATFSESRAQNIPKDENDNEGAPSQQQSL